MGKNDFDIDFDFEKEYGIDPADLMTTEEYDETMDFTGEDFDIPETVHASETEEDDFDFDADLSAYLNSEEDPDVPDFFTKTV